MYNFGDDQVSSALKLLTKTTVAREAALSEFLVRQDISDSDEENDSYSPKIYFVYAERNAVSI